MKKIYDRTDEYYILMTDRILKLAPLIALCAAVTFTLARLLGAFAFVGFSHIVLFDIVCLTYFIDAHIVKKVKIDNNKSVNKKDIFVVNIAVDALILVQWNLISYIFPTESFWGYAPMFVLLSAFLFNSAAVLIEISGISVSILISWFILGDKLLPGRDDLFIENLTLRIVCLIISFTVIYFLTYYAEKFTQFAKENFSSISKQNEELENMGRDVIDFTADIIEERDSTSGSHVKRLKAYTRILGKQVASDWPEYNLTDDKIEQISLACVLHDVGKICISDNILLKPGKLTPEEFDVIKTHTTLGARIIDKLPDSVGEDYKRYCREICLFHHEKYDGRGYPTGLKGDDIPISAQIVSVVDCYDALTNERPYKSALPGEVAINMILNGECGCFSDKIKKSIVSCKNDLLNT